MLKSAYGLSDAPLLWYQEADRKVASQWMVASPSGQVLLRLHRQQQPGQADRVSGPPCG